MTSNDVEMKQLMPSTLLGFFDRPLKEPSPLAPFIAIGDIHGCAALLEDLLTKLATEAPVLPVICVGDYIDRGLDSAGVLARLMAFEAEHPADVICLMGNHEAMCLDFIDTPSEAGPVWLRNGGEQTLNSFGIPAPNTPNKMKCVRDQLVAAMGDTMIRWLRARPLFWQSGNVIVSHAGGNPRVPLNPRRGHGLLWGHRDTLSRARRDGNWMVHGHFITANLRPVKGRIPVDTGAFNNGVLTAAVVGEEGVRFLQAREV